MIEASLFDLAEAYICRPKELDVPEKEQRIQLIHRRANEIARLAGVDCFLQLSEGGASKIAKAIELSRSKFDELASEGSLKSASCYAVVHLMALNRLKGLEGSEQARTTAEVGELCFDMEQARLEGRRTEL